MQQPAQIVFRDVDASTPLRSVIEEKIARLERLSDRIVSCRVAVERAHKSHHKGNLYHVRIDFVLPTQELVVSRAHNDAHAHEDPYVAVRDAFAAAERQLETHMGRRNSHGGARLELDSLEPDDVELS